VVLTAQTASGLAFEKKTLRPVLAPFDTRSSAGPCSQMTRERGSFDAMHIHLIGVAGTGMAALAGLLKSAGHVVSGSDTAFNPPMGPALERWGVRCMPGFRAENLDPTPDLVVVGNVCR